MASRRINVTTAEYLRDALLTMLAHAPIKATCTPGGFGTCPRCQSVKTQWFLCTRLGVAWWGDA